MRAKRAGPISFACGFGRVSRNDPRTRNWCLPPEKGPEKPSYCNLLIRFMRLIELNLLLTSSAQATSRIARSTPSIAGIGCCLERLNNNQSSSAGLEASRHTSTVRACAHNPGNSGIDPKKPSPSSSGSYVARHRGHDVLVDHNTSTINKNAACEPDTPGPNTFLLIQTPRLTHSRRAVLFVHPATFQSL